MGNPLRGVDCDVWISTSTSTALGAPETANDSGDHITYNMATHKFWDRLTPVVVQNSPNGSTGWVTVTDYVFQYAGGVIVFNTARVVSTNNFTRILTGNFMTTTRVDDARGWSLSLKANMAKSTVFQATGGWETNLVTTKAGTVKFDTFKTDDLLAKELGKVLVCQLYLEKSINNARWEFFALFDGADPKSGVDILLEQAVSATVDGPAYFYAS
jgi:hypothetical protein